MIRLTFLLLITQSAIAAEQHALLGTWELIDVSALDEAPAHGIPAVKYYFAADNRLFILAATEGLSADTLSVEYRYQQPILVFQPPGYGIREVPVQLIDQRWMRLIFGDQQHWTFRRIDGPRSHDQVIEPRPVGVLQAPPEQVQLSNLDIRYDRRDYSELALEQRIVGVWEAIAYSDVAHLNKPPTGFANLKHIFTQQGHVYIVPPAQTSLVGQPVARYRTSGSTLIIELADRSEVRYTVSFNRWGHLILAGVDAIQTLKLVQKGVDSIPALPLKMCLLELR